MAKTAERKHFSGGNPQREAFMARAHGEGGKMRTDPEVKGTEDAKTENTGDATTEITHHEDGTHTVKHADGETSEHPSLGHAMMAVHAKQGGDNAVHAEHDGVGITTHAMKDGEVESREHEGPEEAGEYMKQCLGEDGGNGAVEQSDGMSHHGVDAAALY